MVQVRRGYWEFRFCGFGYFLDQFYVGGHASRITPETSTLQCGTLTSISLRTMASNLPTRQQQKKLKDLTKQLSIASRFYAKRGRGKEVRIECGFAVTS